MTEGCPFAFDVEKAADACWFVEQMPHVEGRWETKTIKLHASHVFFLVNLFGFRNLEGGRRFTTALLAVARKNAKSTLAAAILLYCLCNEDELGAQLITAATTGSQARVVFRLAKAMVEATPDLREAFALEPFANAIARWQNGGSIKPINAKASTQDGLNPSHVVLDEIHAHKTHDLLNVLQSAAGARQNPLWLYTTTEGYETPGPWPELRLFAQQILQGVLNREEVDHVLAVIYALDDEIGQEGDADHQPADDAFDESKWIKANPLIDVNPLLLREIRKASVEAKQMAGRLAEFLIKRCNRQSSTSKGFIRYEKWKACAGAVDLAMLEKHQCWGGLDLASTTDFCSFRLVWQVDGIYYTWGRRWVPASAVARRVNRGTVPYQSWVGSGALEVIDGEVIDHAIVEREILEAKNRFSIQGIAYDTWNAANVAANLKKEGLVMEPFIQGPKSYHPAIKEFETAYVASKLRHGGDPVLSWCASNIVLRYDDNLNSAPDKKRSGDKIDDMVALLMAIGLKIRQQPKDFQLFVI